MDWRRLVAIALCAALSSCGAGDRPTPEMRPQPSPSEIPAPSGTPLQATPRPSASPRETTAPSGAAQLWIAARWRDPDRDRPWILLRSDDGGKTWAIEQSPVDDVAISGIAVAGRDAAWVTVGSGEVYFTADGGASWQKQGQELAASFIEPRFVGVATAGRSVVAVGRDQLGTIGATVNFPPMIARSTDGGATWSPAVLLSGAHSVAPLYDACLLDSGVGLAVSNGFDGQVVFTTGDDGATWGLSYEGATALRYACGGGSDLWLVDFEFGDGVTVTKPLRSRDAGQTWEDVSEHIPGTLSSGAESPDLSVGAIVFADAMRGWLFGSLVVARDPETRQPTATQPTALETFDGGDTWRKADLPLPEADVYVALASRRHVVALGRSGGLLFSDGEWEQFSLPAEVMVVFPEATAITD